MVPRPAHKDTGEDRNQSEISKSKQKVPSRQSSQASTVAESWHVIQKPTRNGKTRSMIAREKSIPSENRGPKWSDGLKYDKISIPFSGGYQNIVYEDIDVIRTWVHYVQNKVTRGRDWPLEYHVISDLDLRSMELSSSKPLQNDNAVERAIACMTKYGFGHSLSGTTTCPWEGPTRYSFHMNFEHSCKSIRPECFVRALEPCCPELYKHVSGVTSGRGKFTLQSKLPDEVKCNEVEIILSYGFKDCPEGGDVIKAWREYIKNVVLESWD